MVIDRIPARGYSRAMLATPDSIHDVFGDDGPFARAIEDFESRPSQTAMAELVLEAIRTRRPAIIEAGTGTGKTLGYLVPLVLGLKRAVISTGTKNLQEQIFFKDIPLLVSATGLKINAVLMKGRKNYLCLHRYHQTFSQSNYLRRDLPKIRKRIEAWLERTEYADRAELDWMGDEDPLWDAISSTSEQCLGTDCLHWEDCYLAALRRKAAQADVIIVNHHLFFADLLVKQKGFGEILPPFQVVVFDEAHGLEEIATTYFGRSLGTRQIQELVRDAERASEGLSSEERAAVRGHLEALRTGALQLAEALQGGESRGRLDAAGIAGLLEGPGRRIARGLRGLHGDEALRTPGGGTPLQACIHRAQTLDQALEEVLAPRDADWLNWYERRKTTVVLHASPLDIAASMDEALYQKIKTLIFTSATLSTNGNFHYFRSRMGLGQELLEGIYPTHFDLENQTLLYVPRDLPPPSSPHFADRIAARIREILDMTRGRALVLFTSYNNLNRVHQLLRGRIPFTLFRQGEAPKSLLLEAFKKDTHSILLATGSFWQGVDVPGETLSCLIIDKLPFESPGEPLVAARVAAIQARKGNPFMEYQLPRAVISLKQGLGRLIRNRSDRGILCVLDSRMVNSRYGRHFLESLPGIPLTDDLGAIHSLLGDPRNAYHGQDGGPIARTPSPPSGKE